MTFDEWCEDFYGREGSVAELADLRGGCNCCVSPPCGACSNPITEDEAEQLGWERP